MIVYRVEHQRQRFQEHQNTHYVMNPENCMPVMKIGRKCSVVASPETQC